MISRELSALYSGIAERGFACMQNSGEFVDAWLGQPERDTRTGITLLIRVPEEAGERILRVEDRLQKAEPGQYYYPAKDLHITVIDLLAARPGLVCPEELIGRYDATLTRILTGFGPFPISFRGIMASEGALMVKGYCGETLQDIRRSIRCGFRQEFLPLEERYETISAHVTFARFAKPINNREALSRVLKEDEALNLGDFPVKSLQLVQHNWYDSKKTVLAEYPLNGPAA